MTTKLSSRRFSPRVILLLCALLLLWNLGYATFWNPDEGRYAASSLEMARGFDGQNPDWIVPHLNTIARLNKPPLVYWLAATFYQIFGAHEWSGRLGSAFFAILTMLLIWQIARKTWNERVGLFAAMIWTTSLLPFIMARTLNTDMLLCGAITLAMFGLWRGIEYSIVEKNSAQNSEKNDAANNDLAANAMQSGGENSARNLSLHFDWMAFAIAGIGIGLALLAKGPVGAVLPLAISFLFLLAARRWNVLRDARIWTGVFVALLLGIAIVTPWTLVVQSRYPSFLHSFLLGENVARFTGGKAFHPEPFYYYVPVVLLGLLPWTPLLFTAFKNFPRDFSIRQDRTLLFAWMWAAIIIVGFSASSTKLLSYVLPAFPALAILCAVALHRVLERPLTRAIPIAIGVLNALLLAGCAYGALSETLMPRGDGAPYFVVIAVVLMLGSLWIWREWKAARASRLAWIHGATYGALFVVLLSFAGKVAPYEDSSSLVATLSPYLKPNEKLVQMQFQPTAIFYAARPIVTVGFANASGLSDAEIRRSPLFLASEASYDKTQNVAQKVRQARALSALLNAAPRVFVLIKRREYAQARKQIAPLLKSPTFVIGRSNHHLLLSNRAAPPGFSFQYVAPKARDRELAPNKKRAAPPSPND